MKALVLAVIGLIVLMVLTAPSPPDPTPPTLTPEEIALIDVEMKEGVCSQPKCVVVYVAPWCPHCHNRRPTIISLVHALRQEGIPVEVVIGKDSITEVREYARKYPFPVSYDAGGDRYRNMRVPGVPYFRVINASGKSIKSLSGGFNSVGQLRAALKV
ncbi:peroxiredoxin family protein [Thaumasiovibrio subtropicus]|uniref:peroxiredoxin family protein n=1 Tax=Thaumasiovibrio subtropicus TaxID=1891207 RepID=UPI000B35C70A|nr:thioredoxin domain-containing protein [Thaumasiovibrio subtropicus]